LFCVRFFANPLDTDRFPGAAERKIPPPVFYSVFSFPAPELSFSARPPLAAPPIGTLTSLSLAKDRFPRLLIELKAARRERVSRPFFFYGERGPCAGVFSKINPLEKFAP